MATSILYIYPSMLKFHTKIYYLVYEYIAKNGVKTQALMVALAELTTGVSLAKGPASRGSIVGSHGAAIACSDLK